MKIVINAINLKSAGGLTVALNFIDQINRKKQNDLKVTVLAPTNAGYEKYATEYVNIEIVSDNVSSPYKRVVTDYTWLMKRIEEIKPDVVFSMGNIAAPTQRRQAVLFMFPYSIYLDDVYIWNLMTRFNRLKYRFKNWIFSRRLKYTDVVFPQTKTSEERLLRYYPHIKNTKIVPMAYSTLGQENSQLASPLFTRKEGYRYLLCLTKYYMHKNVEVFLPLAQLIKNQGLPIKIVTTIGADQAPGAAQFLENVNRLDLEDVILNIGPVSVDTVPSLYAMTDGLILPTLLESFSATYADALHYKKPIFTADRDFAHDVCADCAFYFNPHNPKDILTTIQHAFENPNLLNEKVEKGFIRSETFPDWEQVADMYLSELKILAES